MNYGAGCRPGSDLALLWLWCRWAAIALFRPLAWEAPYAVGAALKKQKTLLNLHGNVHSSMVHLVPKQKQPKYSSVDEQNTVCFCNGVLLSHEKEWPAATIWWALKIILGERGWLQEATYCVSPFTENVRTGKSIGTESTFWRAGTAHGYQVSPESHEDILKLAYGDGLIAHLWKYAKHHSF